METIHFIALPVLVVAGIVDLPLSLAADTIVLPFDVAELAKQNKEKKE